MILKVVGSILAFFGILLIIYFPTEADHEIQGFTFSGIFIGIVLILVGAVLVIFG